MQDSDDIKLMLAKEVQVSTINFIHRLFDEFFKMTHVMYFIRNTPGGKIYNK